MNTLGLGPHGWDFLFLVAIDAFQRKEGDKKMFTVYKEQYINFFTLATASILPCIHCRKAWKSFNDPHHRNCVNGCWGSILKFFIESTQCKDDFNILAFWLYGMKNKVTLKLLRQEDEKMHEEILKKMQADKKQYISKDQYNQYEKTINKEMNIKRINREKKTFPEIYNKYLTMYKSQHIDYFPFLFATTFNSEWSTDENNKTLLQNNESKYIDYFTYYLPMFIPHNKMREILAHKAPPVLSLPMSDHPLSRWLHEAFLELKEIPEEKLPSDFAKLTERYERWRVSCSKDNSVLKTCRSSTPNRNAPLIP